MLPVENCGEDYVSQAALRVESLERRIRQRVHRKRCLNRLNLEICPGTEISVGIYVNIIKAGVLGCAFSSVWSSDCIRMVGTAGCGQGGQPVFYSRFSPGVFWRAGFVIERFGSVLGFQFCID